jgi:galacturan 1,4-alpha-galacturonidase
MFWSYISLYLVTLVAAGTVQKVGNVCTITPDPDGTDDSNAIISAFQQCRTNSRVVFQQNMTYHIEKEMLTTGLDNVVVEQRGYLLVSRILR